MKSLSLLLAFAATGGVLVANGQHAAHPIPVVPLTLLERPVTIRTGIGSVHDAVATKSPEAQRFYDQGLVYLHSYIWIEAARSFNQALDADASLAVAQAALSVAYAELNKAEDAKVALQRAREGAAGLPDHDRRHIDLRALQFEAESKPQDKARLAAYRQALDLLASSRRYLG